MQAVGPRGAVQVGPAQGGCAPLSELALVARQNVLAGMPSVGQSRSGQVVEIVVREGGPQQTSVEKPKEQPEKSADEKGAKPQKEKKKKGRKVRRASSPVLDRQEDQPKPPPGGEDGSGGGSEGAKILTSMWESALRAFASK